MHKPTLIGATLALALLAPTGRDLRATGSTADIVFEWNQILQDTVPAPQNPLTPRFFSMTHIAMFDAINAIEREFEPYRVRAAPVGLRIAGGRGGASRTRCARRHQPGRNRNLRCGARASARSTSVRLCSPRRQRRRPRRTGGSAVAAERRLGGLTISSRIPSHRCRDATSRPHRTTPTPAFTHLQYAAPMALLTATQYLPPPPPSLTSARYATDLNEVKAIGKSDSATRTAEQTAIARLWAGIPTTGVGTATNFLSIWNNIVRDVARERRLSLVETARLFVLVNVSVHDGLQTAQTSKFVYGLWRPVTAIRQADTDLNPATDPDPSWLPLLTTPPYPSYAGNMATIGASAARALQLAFGTNDIPVTATWRQSGGLPDVSHSFDGFWEAAQEQTDSRIYGGIHYRFDHDAGHQIGRSAAEFVAANYMRPRSRWDD